MIRYLIGICVWAGAVLSLGACSYSEEDSWKICCNLHLVGDETLSPTARKTILEWERGTVFDGNGAVHNWIGWNRWAKQQITSGLTGFLAGNPEARASDYLLSLGMTCSHAIIAKDDDVTRCNIELPVWVECTSLNVFYPGGAPVPKQLRKPIHALLRESIDVSAFAVLDTSTLIVPVPGGRLCHR